MREQLGVLISSAVVPVEVELFPPYLLLPSGYPQRLNVPPQLAARNFPHILNFSRLNYIYNNDYNNNNDNKDYNSMKRIYRNDMPQAQKDKIAQANTGKTLSPETRRRISQSMAKYWAGLPLKPNTSSGTTDTGNTVYYDD